MSSCATGVNALLLPGVEPLGSCETGVNALLLPGVEPSGSCDTGVRGLRFLHVSVTVLLEFPTVEYQFSEVKQKYDIYDSVAQGKEDLVCI